jgi:hypothetical protein
MSGRLSNSPSLTSRRASTRLCLIGLAGWALLVAASVAAHHGVGIVVDGGMKVW